MVTALEYLRAQARIVHRRAARGDAGALARIRDARGDSTRVLRWHCLGALARELGFEGWSHAVAVLDGRPVRDFGTLFYPPRCAGHWNIWCATYEEARRIHADHPGYLLPYKEQFLVVDAHFIETLGLDPDDPDWERIGRDWVRPADHEARARMYASVVRARQPPISGG